MLFQDLMEEVIIGLGGSLVDVELSEDEIRLALKRAIRQFQQKGHNTYRKAFLSIDVQPNVKTYTIPDNIVDGIRVIRPNSSGIWSSEDLFVKKAVDEMLPNKTTGGCTGVDMLEYELTLAKIETYNKYTVQDVDFSFDKFRHQLVVYQAPVRAEKWFVECYENLSEEEYMDVIWIQQWTSAEAKQMLGQAYRKFSTLAGPHGDVQLSGDALISEARDEMDRLLMDIENMVDGEVGFWGVYLG